MPLTAVISSGRSGSCVKTIRSWGCRSITSVKLGATEIPSTGMVPIRHSQRSPSTSIEVTYGVIFAIRPASVRASHTSLRDERSAADDWSRARKVAMAATLPTAATREDHPVSGV